MKPPHFPLYVRDFVSDDKVEAMTTREVGAYILLLCKAWHADPPGSIPADDAVLARWTRLSAAEWSECRTGVLAAFSLGTDGRYHQKRMRQEYEKLVQLYRARSKGGKKGAESRWREKESETQERKEDEAEEKDQSPACADGSVIAQSWLSHNSPIGKNMAPDSVSVSRSSSFSSQKGEKKETDPSETDREGGVGGGENGSANGSVMAHPLAQPSAGQAGLFPPEPAPAVETSKKTTKKKPGSPHDPDFDLFWAAYPHKTGKRYARECWENWRSEIPPIEQVLAAVSRYIAYCQSTGQLWANPSTWINQHRWEDEPAPVAAKPTILPMTKYGARTTAQSEIDRLAQEHGYGGS